MRCLNSARRFSVWGFNRTTNDCFACCDSCRRYLLVWLGVDIDYLLTDQLVLKSRVCSRSFLKWFWIVTGWHDFFPSYEIRQTPWPCLIGCNVNHRVTPKHKGRALYQLVTFPKLWPHTWQKQVEEGKVSSMLSSLMVGMSWWKELRLL